MMPEQKRIEYRLNVPVNIGCLHTVLHQLSSFGHVRSLQKSYNQLWICRADMAEIVVVVRVESHDVGPQVMRCGAQIIHRGQSQSHRRIQSTKDFQKLYIHVCVRRRIIYYADGVEYNEVGVEVVQ